MKPRLIGTATTVGALRRTLSGYDDDLQIRASGSKMAACRVYVNQFPSGEYVLDIGGILKVSKAKEKQKLIELPKYIRIGGPQGTAMVKTGSPTSPTYWRHAGCWGLRLKMQDGQWVCHKIDGNDSDHLRGVPVFPCTFEEWKEDNKGYLANDEWDTQEENPDEVLTI